MCRTYDQQFSPYPFSVNKRLESNNFAKSLISLHQSYTFQASRKQFKKPSSLSDAPPSKLQQIHSFITMPSSYAKLICDASPFFLCQLPHFKNLIQDFLLALDSTTRPLALNGCMNILTTGKQASDRLVYRHCIIKDSHKFHFPLTDLKPKDTRTVQWSRRLILLEVLLTKKSHNILVKYNGFI